MNKKSMEYSFIKLVLIIFIVLLLMMAVYKFYWQNAKRTIGPTTDDLAQQWQDERDKMQETTGTVVGENTEGGG